MTKILDVCCGPRSMWYDPTNPNVIYGDCRNETIIVKDQSHGKIGGTRSIQIAPDILLDFRTLPFYNNTFDLVAFDPPHARTGPKSWLGAKYGKLSPNWKEDIKQGFKECLRVLKTTGTLIFKWNETHVRLSQIMKLTPHKPLFGQVAGRHGKTHWMVFMKTSSHTPHT